MKKILFLLHLPPPAHGSAIMGQLLKESKAINSVFQTRYIDLGTSGSMREIGQFSLRKIRIYSLILFRTFRDLLFFNPQAVYIAISATGVSLVKDAAVIFLIKLFKKKTIIHMHNHGVKDEKHSRFKHRIYRFIFKNSEVILLSDRLIPDIEDFVNPKQIHICANGIEEINPDIPLTGKEKLPVRILFLSNLMQAKGVFQLLKACRLLQEENLGFECVFAGNEADITRRDFEEKAAQLQISSRVRFLGPRYGSDKIREFTKADIFVLPTLKDVFPLVLLEAMQFSLPVVASCEGGIPEIIHEGENGFLVPKGNVNLLFKRLKTLIENPGLRQDFGTAGNRLFKAQYTATAFENRMLNILNKIV